MTIQELYFATATGDVAKIAALLDAGTYDLTDPNIAGNAAAGNHGGALELLATYGVTMDRSDGLAPLVVAVQMGATVAVETLIRLGADVKNPHIATTARDAFLTGGFGRLRGISAHNVDLITQLLIKAGWSGMAPLEDMKETSAERYHKYSKEESAMPYMV